MFGDMFLMSSDTNKPHSSRSIGGLSTLGTGTLLFSFSFDIFFLSFLFVSIEYYGVEKNRIELLPGFLIFLVGINLLLALHHELIRKV